MLRVIRESGEILSSIGVSWPVSLINRLEGTDFVTNQLKVLKFHEKSIEDNRFLDKSVESIKYGQMAIQISCV